MKFTNVLVAATIFATTSVFAFAPAFAQQHDEDAFPPPPPPHGDRMERGERPPHPDHKDKLNLTDEQKAKAKAIFKKAQDDKNALLTDEQKTKMKERMEKRDHKDFKKNDFKKNKKHHGFGHGLNLTEEQQAKIKAIDEWEKTESTKIITKEQKDKVKEIRKKAKEDRMNVLTDEQKKQMEEMKAHKKGHHGHHHKMHKGNENFRGVELTDDQKTKFKAIDEKARKDFEKILTDSQKKTLKEARENSKKHHEHNDR